MGIESFWSYDPMCRRQALMIGSKGCDSRVSYRLRSDLGGYLPRERSQACLGVRVGHGSHGVRGNHGVSTDAVQRSWPES